MKKNLRRFLSLFILILTLFGSVISVHMTAVSFNTDADYASDVMEICYRLNRDFQSGQVDWNGFWWCCRIMTQ